VLFHRIANGVLIEHCDTLQDEVTQAESKSGLPITTAPAAAIAATPAAMSRQLRRRRRPIRVISF
jgi:hypothetical protein